MAGFDPLPPLPVIAETAELTAVSLGPAQPLVMLPVRLETRFFPRTGGGMDLRVRVYPDKIHIDTHEPPLIEQEVIWGKHFWQQTEAAGDEPARRLAWRQLVERFGAGRAAWVARTLRPTQGANNEPPKPIIFPEVETKAEAWTRAPFAAALPARWHVLGYARGELILKASGNPIPKNLATGPEPLHALGDIPADELAIDEGMKWMVDFAEAEKKGMGISISLDPRQAEGFDFLLVVGTRENTPEADESAELAALLDAHHYTDGMNFILQGTPTNNTADAPSGFNSFDPGHEESYLAELKANEFKPGDGTNAGELTRAFGFTNGSAETLAHLGNSSVTEHADAGHMNRALWAATWGYFLSQMMNGSPLTAEDCDWAREHFADYVRAAGPFPAIRVGRQPYGILPVTSLNLWKARSGQEEAQQRDSVLRDFLIRLSTVWRNNLPEVPRVGRTADKPDQDFADILSMDGLSSQYAIRHLMGRSYLENIWSLLFQGDQKIWWARQEELTRAALNLVGLDWKPRLANATYTGWYKALKGPISQPETLSEQSPLEPNHIELLLTETDFDKLWQEKFDEFQPQGLLYALLRHSLLWEYYAAAGDLIAFKATQSNIRFFDFEQEVVTPNEFSIWSMLKKPLPEIAAMLGKPLTGIDGESLWKFLLQLESAPSDPEIAKRVSALLRFRESVSRLKNIRAARLERLLAGTLDLCSHRLDAWITSFATRRLAEIRRTSPNGVIIGGYGWVVNLRPNVSATTNPANNEPRLVADNPGFTHAPSLPQAATVAVLRSGHLSHSSGDSATENALAIDLSSERVRLVEWLLDGVRQGQPLGALLGYRFERRLQDARLGDYIPVFREVAPLVAKRLEQTADQDPNLSVEAIAANNVVDGLALHNKWKRMKELARVSLSLVSGPLAAMLVPVAKKPDPARFQDARPGLEATLELLDDAVDAVSDALIAESVHQAVQGNPLRTASTLDAIASGAAPPPELEVVRTPRTGMALVHRLVTLFSGKPVLPAEWGTPVVTFRANAEPNLNAWAAKLLGDPARVRCQIERIDPDTTTVLESKELRLNELQISPLDFIYATEGSRDAQPSEIEQRMLYALRRKPGGFGPDDVLRINPARAEGLPINELGYGEFAELLRTARNLITGARGLDASELNLAERNQAAAVDLADLKSRADQAEQHLRETLSELRALANSAGNLEALRTALLRTAHLGVAGSVPVSASRESPPDREALSSQANSIAGELEQREQTLSALQLGFDENRAPDDEKQKHHIARLRVVFGESFVVLPRFTAGNANELAEALTASTAIQDNDPLAVVSWFQRASRVRAGATRLDASLRYAEALETGEKLNLRVVQLPHDPNGRWVGLPLLPGKDLSQCGLSLVVQSADDLDATGPLTGLLIDEWVEVVPNANETTGVTFQYDQPDAAPPHCILLAVPPDLTRGWDLWSLPQVLLETLDLARLRAVDPDALDEVGHYLPALYFAVNTARDTAAIDFSH